MRVYWHYLKIGFKSQLIYKTSFVLLCIGQFFVPFFVFIGVVLLFQRFENLGGYSFYEVALLFGAIHMSFSLAEAFARGFDYFSQTVVKGDFDRILLRPLPTAFQVLGSRFEFTRIGRLIQGVVVLWIGVSHVTFKWTLAKVICLINMVLGGTALMMGLFIFFATVCFWTIEGLEIANIFTDGGREMSQYPLTIYTKPIRTFFTYIVPFGVVNYLPFEYLVSPGISGLSYQAFLPLLGILFLVPCLLFWSFGVRHYKSTGS